MKLTTAMMAVAVLVGSAAAQTTNVIDNTRNTLNQVQQKQTNASNAALNAAQGQPAAQPKPSAAVPSKSATQVAQNSAPVQAAKPATATPAAAKPATPAPATTVPAKSAAATPAAKPAVATSTTTPAKANVAAANTSSKTDAKKPAKAEKVTPVNVIVPKIPQEKPTMTKKAMAAAAAAEAKPVETKEAKAGDKAEDKDKDKPKEYSSLGKRDPFLSPVVAHVGGSGCSTGKKCLDIAQINLRGVVKADSGMIAVVTNSLNKAYFLRENDPVFNGYVIKITGDSIVFKESYQDQLGKPMTRDVTKKITTPAV